MKLITGAMLLLNAASAFAQVQPDRPASQISPEIGSPVVASAGSPVFERRNMIETPRIKILGDAPEAGLKSGMLLLPLQDNPKKVAACGPDRSVGGGCVVDRSPSNQQFTLASNGLGTKVRPLANPVGYERGHWSKREDPAGTFKQQLTFLGVSGSTLRLSYREFVNDMARPAFTDEVTFTLSGTFPERIAYKDVVIDVLGISNAGMNFVVREASEVAMLPPSAK